MTHPDDRRVTLLPGNPHAQHNDQGRPTACLRQTHLYETLPVVGSAVLEDGAQVLPRLSQW